MVVIEILFALVVFPFLATGFAWFMEKCGFDILCFLLKVAGLAVAYGILTIGGQLFHG